MQANTALNVKSLVEKLDKISLKGNKHRLHDKIDVVSYDSRDIYKQKTIFFAIPGFKKPAVSFIESAIEKGCTTVICESFPSHINPSCLYIKVENARKSLAIVAKLINKNASDHLYLVGVTGTNGKTTVARLSQSILENHFGKAGFIGTTGIRMSYADSSKPLERTTPESLDLHRYFRNMVAEGTKAVAMEASSHGIALHRTHGLNFQAAIFTNLSQDHLDFHQTVDAYFETKKRLFKELPNTSWQIINIDDPYGKTLINKNRTITYSLRDRSADIFASIERLSLQGTSVSIYLDGNKHQENLPLIGSFNIYNILAAMGIGVSLNMNYEKIVESLKKVTEIEGRMQIFRSSEGQTAIVDYAHTPDGLQKAILSILDAKEKSSKLITVFGCGGNRDRRKRSLMGKIASQLSDRVILTSDNSRDESPKDIINDIASGTIKSKITLQENRALAITEALMESKKGDIILIAGKGHETYQEERGKRTFFDDRLIIKSVFNHGRRN